MVDMQNITKKGYAFLTLLLALLIDYFWGPFIFDFASGLTGDEAIIIKLMVTFVLMFMTFVIPILLFTDKINPHPLNIIYGLGALIIGIPCVMMVFWLLMPIVDLLITGSSVIIFQFCAVFIIIAFGFLLPMYTMIQEDPIIPTGVDTE